MDNKVFEEKISRKVEVDALLKSLTAEKEKLSDEIAKEIETRRVDFYLTSDNNVVTYTTKTAFKYNDEAKIIEYLKANNLNDCIEVSIIKTALNNKLKDDKTNGKLIESLEPFYKKNVSYVTSVMTKENYDKQQEHIKKGK